MGGFIMEIMNKKRKDYIYLFANRNKKEAFYLDEKTERFYKIKTESFDTKYGFLALFLAPLNLILVEKISNNTWEKFFMACILGFIIGYIFLVITNNLFFKRSFEEIKLTSKEIEHSILNLKEVLKIKCALIVGWVILFLIIFMMFLTENNYKSLISISIMCMFSYPLITNIGFTKYRQAKKILKELAYENKSS